MAKGNGAANGILTPSDEQDKVRRANKAARRSRSGGQSGRQMTHRQQANNAHSNRWHDVKLGAVAPSVMKSTSPSASSSKQTAPLASAVSRKAEDAAARAEQVKRAYDSLNLPVDSYEDRVALHFLDHWSTVVPVKVEGKSVISRTQLAKEATLEGLPENERKSAQVKAILGKVSHAIWQAGR